MSEPPLESVPMISEFENDPEMRELVSFFVQDLQQRYRALNLAREHGDWAGVGKISHQLRGSAAGYGFPSLGEIAGRIEDLLKPGRAMRMTELRNELDEFALMCERIFLSAARHAA